MKIIYQTILLIIISQIAFGQTKVTFDLSNSSIQVNGSVVNGNPIALKVASGKVLTFEVKNPPAAGFNLTITVKKAFVIINNGDFVNGTIQTDANLNYKGLSLASAFTVKIPLANANIVQGFTVNKPTVVTTTTTNDTSANKTAVQKTTRVTIPYYDAISLQNYKTLDLDSLHNLLASYNGGLGNPGDLIKMINGNPFFPDTLKTGLVKTIAKYDSVQTALLKLPGVQAQGALNVAQAGMSTMGGLDVTNIANGIADLMIERAKEELTVAFFNRFSKFSKENPEFQILFPKTTNNLSNLLSYTYPQMLPALRTGFLDDISKITYNLGDVLALPRYQTLLRNLPEIRVAIKSLRLATELETGTSNAADIINEFASFSEWDDPKLQHAGSYLKVANMFSESIRNDVSQSHDVLNAWVDGKELKKLFDPSNPALFNIYMGLLYQNSLKIDFQSSYGSKFSDVLNAQKTFIFKIQNMLKQFFDLTAKVNAVYTDIQKKVGKPGQSPTNDDYYNYINVSIDVADYAYGIGKMFDDKLPPDNFISIVRKSNSLYRDIYTKQYTQAIGDAFDIFSQLDSLALTKDSKNIDSIKSILVAKLNDPSYSVQAKDDVKKLVEGSNKMELKFVSDKNIENVVKANITDPNIAQLTEYYNLQHLLDFIQKVKPYALFMANMVEAKSSDDVKAALENVILPVGSSSIKKNTLFNISVQSYLGAYYVTANGSTALGSWSDRFGVTAPIGISLTPGFLSWRKGGSLSLFVPLFDLGAIVDYKLKTDSANNGTALTNKVSKDYSVKLGQIVSPGVYAVYGFFDNLPLSLGFGAQYGPGLAKIDEGNNTVVSPSWRWNIFLAVDLPFFTLKNTNRGK